MNNGLEALGYKFLKTRRGTHLFGNESTETCIQINSARKTILKVRGKSDAKRVSLTDLEKYISEGIIKDEHRMN